MILLTSFCVLTAFLLDMVDVVLLLVSKPVEINPVEANDVESKCQDKWEKEDDHFNAIDDEYGSRESSHGNTQHLACVVSEDHFVWDDLEIAKNGSLSNAGGDGGNDYNPTEDAKVLE